MRDGEERSLGATFRGHRQPVVRFDILRLDSSHAGANELK